MSFSLTIISCSLILSLLSYCCFVDFAQSSLFQYEYKHHPCLELAAFSNLLNSLEIFIINYYRSAVGPFLTSKAIRAYKISTLVTILGRLFISSSLTILKFEPISRNSRFIPINQKYKVSKFCKENALIGYVSEGTLDDFIVPKEHFMPFNGRILGLLLQLHHCIVYLKSPRPELIPTNLAIRQRLHQLGITYDILLKCHYHKDNTKKFRYSKASLIPIDNSKGTLRNLFLRNLYCLYLNRALFGENSSTNVLIEKLDSFNEMKGHIFQISTYPLRNTKKPSSTLMHITSIAKSGTLLKPGEALYSMHIYSGQDEAVKEFDKFWDIPTSGYISHLWNFIIWSRGDRVKAPFIYELPKLKKLSNDTNQKEGPLLLTCSFAIDDEGIDAHIEFMIYNLKILSSGSDTEKFLDKDIQLRTNINDNLMEEIANKIYNR